MSKVIHKFVSKGNPITFQVTDADGQLLWYGDTIELYPYRWVNDYTEREIEWSAKPKIEKLKKASEEYSDFGPFWCSQLVWERSNKADREIIATKKIKDGPKEFPVMRVYRPKEIVII